ncbi:hypothetical protein [Streptomyces sp. PU-14G]|uniref:hypothetical protein n=1 Tax=Streptomyces sp. PU-14G TaxID=2800808 RepID=UPI0034DF065E
METLRRCRATVGLLIYLGMYAFHVVSGSDSGFGLSDVVFDGVNASVWATPITYLVVISVMLVVWKRRGYSIRPLGKPILKGVTLMVAYFGVLLFLISFTIGRPESEKVSLKELIFAFWLLFFFVFATLAVARNFFGSAAIHPALPGVLSAIAAWLAALPNPDTSALGVLLNLGGPVSLTAISGLELSRLRQHYGIHLYAYYLHTPDSSGQS